ncbi:MAG: TolC family protein, partial [Muribaculaceae bacterium]|nr:TolC family protein [Muribaculaceae bacterium]
MRLIKYLSSLRGCLAAGLVLVGLGASAQDDAARTLPGVTTLDSFRQMALENNKQLMMQRERIRKAGYQKKEAFAAYLPAIDFAGGYVYNQRELSIFDSDQLLPTKSFDPKTGTYQFNLVTDPATGAPIKGPNGQYIPSTVALIPKEAMTYDIHNVFFGAITLTQPIFMGGKIVALNKLAKAAENAARELNNAEIENVI